MEREMESLKKHNVWELVNLSPGKKAIGSKWVFKVKTNADGSIERYKARLVAQGYNQKFGADYDETFCPVVRQESFRLLIAKSVQQGLEMHHVDVNTAFLNGTLEEEVYLRQPKGFVKEGEQNLVCKLKKSLYGLKQSPRCWNMTLDAHLKSMGFTQSIADPCIYTSSAGGEVFHIGVYVDDNYSTGWSKRGRYQACQERVVKQVRYQGPGEAEVFPGDDRNSKQRTGSSVDGSTNVCQNTAGEV